MRLSHILFTLPFVIAAPAAGNHMNVGEATLHMCMSLTFAPKLRDQQAKLCQCAAEAWHDAPPAYAVFLTNYAHFHEASGGDQGKTEQLTAERMNMPVQDVNGVAGIMTGELSNAALACQ